MLQHTKVNIILCIICHLIEPWRQNHQQEPCFGGKLLFLLQWVWFGWLNGWLSEWVTCVVCCVDEQLSETFDWLYSQWVFCFVFIANWLAFFIYEASFIGWSECTFSPSHYFTLVTVAIVSATWSGEQCQSYIRSFTSYFVHNVSSFTNSLWILWKLVNGALRKTDRCLNITSSPLPSIPS